MHKPKLKFSQEKKQRVNFYASDMEKSGVDITLEFQGVEPTNPPEWNDTLKWGAGKGVELAMVNILKQNGIVDSEFDQESLESTKIEREGVKISMKFDARVKEDMEMETESIGLPQNEKVKLNKDEVIEIKSINNKNSFDIQKYIDGYPRTNYVKQLACYLDALNMTRGHLFASSIDGLNFFWFVCEKQSEGVYKCGNTIVNITDEYKRFKTIWDNLKKEIDLGIYGKIQVFNEPNWNEEIYKLPIEKVDWTKLSTTAISEERNNRKVFGSVNSWKILYSSYLDLILEKQKTKRGYTEAELEKIKELTAGYTSTKKKADIIQPTPAK